MKRKMITALLSLSVAGAMAFAPAAAFAASEDTAQTSEAQDTEETDTAEDKVEDLTIKTDTQEVTVKNQAGYALTAGELKDTEADKDAEAEKDTEKKEDASTGKTFTVTAEDGTEHIFENVDPDSWTDPVIYDEYGFLYIKYQDAQKKDQEIAETADEKEWESPVTMYLLSNVNVREQADKESKSLKVLSTGTEVKAVAIVPEWIKVQADDITGYIYHSYITENKEAADAKVKEEKDAKEAKEKAAAEAAAQAAAQAQAAAESAASSSSDSSYDTSYDSSDDTSDTSYAEEPDNSQAAEQEQPYEVSRQQYDDCDGSGHGYYEITYSDGSVSYEEY